MASDADEKCVFTAAGSDVHQSNEGRKVDIRSLLLSTAEAAGKVPVIASWRQGRSPLAGDIFAHRVLARFEQAVAVAVGKIQLKALFHAAPIEWGRTKTQRLALASATVKAVILTMRRTVVLAVSTCTGLAAPSSTGPMAILPPAAVLSRL